MRAIVLRLDSPGGSPLASDLIWREMMLASLEKLDHRVDRLDGGERRLLHRQRWQQDRGSCQRHRGIDRWGLAARS